MTATCSTCPAPATHNGDAGYRRIGDHWVALDRPLCDECGWQAVVERIERWSA